MTFNKENPAGNNLESKRDSKEFLPKGVVGVERKDFIEKKILALQNALEDLRDNYNEKHKKVFSLIDRATFYSKNLREENN